MGEEMQVKVRNLDNQEVGTIELDESIFAIKPRRDILARTVNWQLAKRRAGTHSTKGISQISGTTRKPWPQKGTGRARQGSLRSPQFRKGAVIFGPLPRSHEHDLPKQVRRKALCMALSSKQLEGKLIVLDQAKLDEHKTKPLAAKLEKMGIKSALFIDGANLDPNFSKAIRNIKNIDLLPEQGANVYDILRRDFLVLTKNAVEQLQERLK